MVLVELSSDRIAKMYHTENGQGRQRGPSRRRGWDRTEPIEPPMFQVYALPLSVVSAVPGTVHS